LRAEWFKPSNLELSLLQESQPLHVRQLDLAQINTLQRGEEGFPILRRQSDLIGKGG